MTHSAGARFISASKIGRSDVLMAISKNESDIDFFGSAANGGWYMDDFQKRGHALIDELKEHVLKAFSRDPRGSSDGPGLGTIEVERLCGIGIELDRASERKQEHWITWTILQGLVGDGLLMPIYSDKTRYRRR